MPKLFNTKIVLKFHCALSNSKKRFIMMQNFNVFTIYLSRVYQHLNSYAPQGP